MEDIFEEIDDAFYNFCKETENVVRISVADRYVSKDKIRKIIKELNDQNYNDYELSVALSKSLETLLK